MRQEENLLPSPSDGAGERIRMVRMEKRWTQAELGKRSTISKVMIAQWETGARKPGVDSLHKLARTLDVSFAWLAVGEGNQAFGDPLAEGESSRAGLHNAELNKACVEIVQGFLHDHNLVNEVSNTPELVEDLYGRAVKEGLDRAARTKDAFKLALKELVSISLRLA